MSDHPITDAARGGGYWNFAWKELKDNEIVTILAGDVAKLNDLFVHREAA